MIMNTNTKKPVRRTAAIVMLLSGWTTLHAADQPQWGQWHSRNMVSAETNLPDGFDPETGRNVKWSVPLGTNCWSTAVVANGKVLIGTNNNQPRDPKHEGDRGVLMCLNEDDGSLAWQLVVPKLDADIFFDWPKVGMCSPATVEGDRVYTVTNRDEVVCLDLHGLANGNDGPFLGEGRHMTPHDQPLLTVGPTDADILWLLDLRKTAGVRVHDSAHSSVLLDGQYLYVNTSNGLKSDHSGVDKPNAPSMVVVDKNTGRLVAEDGAGIGPMIFHCTWSSPALGEVGKRRLVFFCGGDGVCYAFDALKPVDQPKASGSQTDPAAPSVATTPSSGEVKKLNRVWRFDCDPAAPKENIHSYIRNRRVSPSNIKSMPVFHNNRVYVTHGGDIWWGKHQAWLKCIDATGTGDITHSGLLWSYPVKYHCCSTPAVNEGLVYAADLSGTVHCVDAKTGRPYWTHDAGGEIYASTLVADGKIYIGTRRGEFWVLAAGRKKRVLSSNRLDDAIHSSCVAANGTVYLSTMTQLFALASNREGAAAD